MLSNNFFLENSFHEQRIKEETERYTLLGKFVSVEHNLIILILIFVVHLRISFYIAPVY